MSPCRLLDDAAAQTDFAVIRHNGLARCYCPLRFIESEMGGIRCTERDAAGRITLAIADNGVGLPPGFDMNAPGSMGLPLVKMLCEQIGGEMTLSGTPGNRVSVTFTR